MLGTQTQRAARTRDNALLDRLQWKADPLADRTAAIIIGTWKTLPAGTSYENAVAAHPQQWQRINTANRLMAQWQTNGSLVDWPASAPGTDDTQPADVEAAEIAAALQSYVRSARALPEWIDTEKLKLAEHLFYEQGVLSCVLLFCASLPECYVAPDLADVLHAAGQLEEHTLHRIRSTAAMIFPVMMRGGLTSPDGCGVAQVLKVRLIHAVIRNLILRGDPEILAAQAQTDAGRVQIPAYLPLSDAAPNNLFHTLFTMGWDIDRDALPCNQEELGYTLLTFHYVYLRGMHTLAVPLDAHTEAAYLHAWNVMAHVLGIDHALMPETMAEAEALFTLMQRRARADASKRPGATDPRPKLGRALMQCMEDVVPLAIAKGFPSLLTKTLCGVKLARELGITGRATLPSTIVYVLIMVLTRLLDASMRVVSRKFSLSRALGRVIGYHLMTKLLLDQTRPLKLPSQLLNQMYDLVDQWSEDRLAPSWLNRLEDRVTVRGQWTAALRRKNE